MKSLLKSLEVEVLPPDPDLPHMAMSESVFSWPGCLVANLDLWAWFIAGLQYSVGDSRYLPYGKPPRPTPTVSLTVPKQ